MRAILLIMLSSGIRLGSLINLRLKHIDLNSYPDIGIIKVPPEYSKSGIGYYYIFNDEAREALETYLDMRRRRGESLTSNSLLFPSNRDPNKPLDANNVRELYRKALRRLGLYKKDEKTHLNEIHLHTLRKYFRTMLEGYLTKAEIERLMGHRGGSGVSYLDGAYFRPPEKDLIAKYRRVMHRLYVFKEAEDERERMKRQALLTLKLLGLPDEKLEAIEEILRRSKDLDEAVDEIRKEISLRKLETNGGYNEIIIVRDEDELIKKLSIGYEIVKELRDGRIILRKTINNF